MRSWSAGTVRGPHPGISTGSARSRAPLTRGPAWRWPWAEPRQPCCRHRNWSAASTTGCARADALLLIQANSAGGWLLRYPPTLFSSAIRYIQFHLYELAALGHRYLRVLKILWLPGTEEF